MKKVLIGVAILAVAAIGIFALVKKSNQNDYQSNPKSMVSVVNNGYMVNKALGGISDVKLTVVNNTDYLVDNARVLVSYFKKNGDLHHQEFVDATNIPPYGSVPVNAPDSDRGTSITLEIYSVTSTAANAY